MKSRIHVLKLETPSDSRVGFADDRGARLPSFSSRANHFFQPLGLALNLFPGQPGGLRRTEVHPIKETRSIAYAGSHEKTKARRGNIGEPEWRHDGATVQLQSGLFIQDRNIEGHPDCPGQTGTSGAALSSSLVEQAPARSVGVRMAPQHIKRKFWWELIFIGVLLFLLAGVPSQRKREAVAAAESTPSPAVALAPAAESSVVVTPLPPLGLK